MPWQVYMRPTSGHRRTTGPNVNINREGFYLNRAACELIGLDENNPRWVLLLYDRNRDDKIGLWFWKDKPKKYADNLYKVTYRELNRTAKITAIKFIQIRQLYEKAKEVKRTTFPLIPDKTKEISCLPFFVTIRAEEPSEGLKDLDSARKIV